MANVVIMPKQGQSVESCIVTEFKKKVGDKVAVGDVLFSYETDKASFEEESKFEGTVLACFFKDNDEIPVLTNVMVIGNEGESFAEFAPGGAAAETAPAAPAAEPAKAEAPAAAPEAEVPAAAVTAGAPVSPRARRTAAEKGVDTAQVAGTGPHGRIIERDVIAAAGSPRTGLAKAMAADGSYQAPAQGSGLAGMVKGSDLKVWQPMHSDIAGEGEEFRAVALKMDENESIFDLTGVYEKGKGLERYIRKAFFDRESLRITITEDFKASQDGVLSLISTETPERQGKIISWSSFSAVFPESVTCEVESIAITDARLRVAWPETIYRTLITLPHAMTWYIDLKKGE